ncbi:hypothetical protein ACHAC9_20155 [Massilia sp. CMS3.1]|uniref:hypothetical protein n=1 Tax=Massilia sp. CMS3.1 TaxID=3373083 RepID=UPI003EE71785
MRSILLCVLSLPLLAWAQPAEVAVSPSKAELTDATVVPKMAKSLRARLTDDVVKQAVRDTLAEHPAKREPAAGGQVFSGDKYGAFSREFAASKKPSCLGPDATKFQPPVVSTKNWTFGGGGLFVLPFWAAAIVKGKCN